MLEVRWCWLGVYRYTTQCNHQKLSSLLRFMCVWITESRPFYHPLFPSILHIDSACQHVYWRNTDHFTISWLNETHWMRLGRQTYSTGGPTSNCTASMFLCVLCCVMCQLCHTPHATGNYFLTLLAALGRSLTTCYAQSHGTTPRT